MKICYINPAVLLRRPVAQIIKKLCNKHEVSLLISRKLFQKRDSTLHYSDLPENVKVYSYASISMPGISSEWPIPVDLNFPYYLFKIFRESDVIHMWAHFYLSNFIVCLFKWFRPKKKLIIAIDTFPGYSFSAGKLMDRLFKIYTNTLAKIVYSAPTKVHLYGESLVKYAKMAGINQNRIKVLSTGITIKQPGKIKDIRPEFNIKQNETMILYAGLLISRKGIDTAIKTIARTKDKKCKLVLVGDGPDKKKYENLAKDLRVEDKVIFAGWRKDMHNFYSAADLLFFPSRGEGLAGVIMEAMTFKLPVLTSNIPCTPDLVLHNKTGVLCEKDNIKEFSENLSILIRDKKLRKKLGEAGYKHIQKFEWRKVIPKYLELYRDI